MNMNRMPHQRLEEGNGDFRSYETSKMTFQGSKKSVFMPSASLFSMALYDFDHSAQGMNGVLHQHVKQQVQPTFHPVDEYKDMSLKEILDLSDDYIFGDDDPLLDSQPAMRMQPIPSSVPSIHQANTVVSVTPSPKPQEVLSFHINNGNARDMSFDASSKKRPRESSSSEEFDAEEEERRFRPYQAGQWNEKFEELCVYRHKMGHCLVPHTFGENLPLARWVKRQRYQYKLMVEGKQSTMTEDRVTALDEIGFIWDSQGAAWSERVNELADFRKIYMHCNVPSNYSENSQLATWVKCQRRQYKLHAEGKASNMTTLRISELESLGFEWELRSYKKARTN